MPSEAGKSAELCLSDYDGIWCQIMNRFSFSTGHGKAYCDAIFDDDVEGQT